MKTREQLEATGNKILNSVRTELYLSMRFMGPALGSLGFAMDLSTRTVGTDAVYIRFNPTYLLQTYIERPEILNRTYMHMLMHCLFRHMFSAKQHEDAQLWDLCCDIAVESVVDSMDYPTILRVTSDFRQEWYEKLEKEVSVLTAEKLYQYFMLRKRDPYLEESLRQEFLLCDHSFWQRMEKEPPQEQNKNQPPVPQENPQMDSDQQEEVKEYYILEDGVYTHEKLKDEERDSLNTIFGKAMLAVTSLQQPETQEALAQQMQLPDGVDVMDAIAQLPDEARSQMMEQMTEKLEDMPESIVTQGAIQYLKNEYQEMGEDLDRIQMQYVLWSGIKMLLLAALIMVASVCVTFFSCRRSKFVKN